MAYSTFTIDIAEFTQGIHSDYHSAPSSTVPSATRAVDGAASEENTYRVCAEPDNSLVPLPARVQVVSEAILPIGNGDTANHPTNYFESYQLDAQVISPASNFGPASGMPYPANNALQQWDSVIVMHAFRRTTNGITTTVHFLARQYNECNRTGGFPLPVYPEAANADIWYTRRDIAGIAADYGVIPSAIWNRTRSAVESSVPPVSLQNQSPVYPCLLVTRGSSTAASNWAGGALSAGDNAITTYDTLVSANFPTILDNPNHACFIFGVTIAASPYTHPLFTRTQEPQVMCAHQGRLVFASNAWNGSVGGVYLLGAIKTVADALTFSTNDGLIANGAAADFSYIAPVSENPSGVSVMQSLNANDLLIVKNYGGGALIQGSLATGPNVVRLPFLHSTYGVNCVGVTTPIGFVYGTRNGVVVFDGNASRSISQQLDGFFWDTTQYQTTPTQRQYTANRGRFGWFDPWVCAPNNYLYDTRTQGWWRLEALSSTQEPYSCYDLSAYHGTLYAFPWRKTTTAQTTYDRYDRSVLAGSWSWQSQPLLQSRERMITVQEVEFMAQPAPGSTTPQVRVTVTGVDEAGNNITPFTTTVNLNASNTRPQSFIKQVANFSARWIQVRIEGLTATGVAPKVYSPFKLHCRDSSRPVRS